MAVTFDDEDDVAAPCEATATSVDAAARIVSLSRNVSEAAQTRKTVAPLSGSSKFDRMFAKKATTAAPPSLRSTAPQAAPSSAVGSSNAVGKTIITPDGQRIVVTAPEGSVDYWNAIRTAMGMSKLRDKK
jgi:hypothetical protein